MNHLRVDGLVTSTCPGTTKISCKYKTTFVMVLLISLSDQALLFIFVI